MSKPTITQHFENLGAPLTNGRWSWGAIRLSDGAPILRVWNDEHCTIDGKRYRKLLDPAFAARPGYPDRERHVSMIRGGAKGFMVIVTEYPGLREIKSFNRTVLVPVGALVTDADGITWGECLRGVAV